MFPIDTADAGAQPPAVPPAGAPGHFQDRNFLAGTEATIVPAWLMEMLVQELLGILTLSGTAPDKSNNRQVAGVIQALLAAESQARQVTDNYVLEQFQNLFGTAGVQNDITNASLLLVAIDNEARRYGGGNFVRVTQSGTLDANQLGMVVIDASAGPITLTLPAANCFASAKAVPRPRLFRRDGSGNQVIIQCAAGGDSYTDCADNNGNPVRYTDLLSMETLDLTGSLVAGGGWFPIRQPRGRLVRYSGAVGNAPTPFSWTCPVGVWRVRARGVAGGASGGPGDGNHCGGGGGAGGGFEKELNTTGGTTISGSVGFAGPGVTNNNNGNGGNAGGTTSVSGTGLYATGGNPGAAGSAYPTNSAGRGGSGYGGDINPAGGSGRDGGFSTNEASGSGGVAPFGYGLAGRAASNSSSGQAGGDNAGTNGCGGGASYGTNAGGSGDGGPGLMEFQPL